MLESAWLLFALAFKLTFGGLVLAAGVAAALGAAAAPVLLVAWLAERTNRAKEAPDGK